MSDNIYFLGFSHLVCQAIIQQQTLKTFKEITAL
jgi:hypothetical protein